MDLMVTSRRLSLMCICRLILPRQQTQLRHCRPRWSDRNKQKQKEEEHE